MRVAPQVVTAEQKPLALALVLVSLLLLAHFEGAPPGSTYVPAHLENGRLVPGAEQPGGAK